jgi:hypothetical protein
MHAETNFSADDLTSFGKATFSLYTAIRRQHALCISDMHGQLTPFHAPQQP